MKNKAKDITIGFLGLVLGSLIMVWGWGYNLPDPKPQKLFTPEMEEIMAENTREIWDNFFSLLSLLETKEQKEDAP